MENGGSAGSSGGGEAVVLEKGGDQPAALGTTGTVAAGGQEGGESHADDGNDLYAGMTPEEIELAKKRLEQSKRYYEQKKLNGGKARPLHLVERDRQEALERKIRKKTESERKKRMLEEDLEEEETDSYRDSWPVVPHYQSSICLRPVGSHHRKCPKMCFFSY